MEPSRQTPSKKPVIVTPAIAVMEELVAEYEFLEADDHAERCASRSYEYSLKSNQRRMNSTISRIPRRRKPLKKNTKKH
jgi:hypothetical protein